jgi:hypothetical protein
VAVMKVSRAPSAAKDAGRASAALGIGCIAAFLFPFAVAGAVMLTMSLRRLAQGNWREGLLLGGGGVLFGGVAVAYMAAMLGARRKLQEQEELRSRHPDQPWLWQRDWAAGRIEDSSRSTLWTSWAFTVFWNMIGFPSGYLGVQAALQQGKPGGYVALIFPLIGIGLLVWAVRSTIRYRKYGVSRLELATIPAVIGHSLAGTVPVSTSIESPEGFLANLSCVRRVTSGSGKNRSTSETVLWQDEQRTTGGRARDAAGWRTDVPVQFRIPTEAESCSLGDPDNRVLWRLTVGASVPGVDYASVFEIPVFRTEASAVPPSESEMRLAAEQARALAEYRQPADSRIRVTNRSQGVEIVFPPARNPGAAAGVTAFTLLWGGICWGLVHYKAPLLFPVVFGLFELLLLWMSLQLWLGVSRVTAEPGKLLLAKGIGSPGGEHTLPSAEVADVIAAIGMQAGAIPYYDVVVRQKDGKKVTAGRSVRDKHEAEWLAVTIKRALDLPTGT